jgi:hypothetical protein
MERLAVLAASRAKRSNTVVDEIRTWLITQRRLLVGVATGILVIAEPRKALVRLLAGVNSSGVNNRA